MKLFEFSLVIWASTCLLLGHAQDFSTHRVSSQSSQTGSQYAACQLPEMCVNISKCPSMLNLLRYRGRDAQVAASLRKLQCGTEDRNPKVCCPESVSARKEYLDKCGKTWGIRHSFPRIARPGDWPWMGALNDGPYNNSVPDFKCTAVLISRQWLIISAHCVQTIHDVKDASVRLGMTDLDSQPKYSGIPVDVPVNQIITHPQYSPNPLFNDIALVQLKYSLYYTEYIRPVCLLSGPQYEKNEYDFRKQPFVFGWIANYDKRMKKSKLYSPRKSSPAKLREGSLRTVNLSKCSQQYTAEKNVIINEKVICAGEPEKDDCQEDPGAALIFANSTELRFKLGGIASFGTGPQSCSRGVPGVYTRIAQFITWISQVTGIKF